ncbi:alpha-N-arabinofuranosidase [Vibrio breoganii]|uniref:Alpha-N-arabinofuranosidase n=1 Tax=Vibrio breoganii TaxID=553239 RepID=A0AAJ3VMH8_9VIBR|nr:glycoside hydrolase family 43 protein [Vibrio breoganii]ANO33760.1 alpha-N-arabinofuranosidase [Vibrio breoganii]PMG00700.1 alpha-N-arabinofuranosidase [Vibrio breoganii]PMG79094.1 alpha-N-arabinofuranosidase [Vibrio breoganii]PMJ44243.1 alpha-N-arabinofuranosidase [Vibrio breoganii]PMK37627.1 alpha-N-arabinofuranosidase [Vibrio breoganii]
MNDTTATASELSDAEKVTARDLERASSLKPISSPLVTHMYTADPSAHVFNGKIYIYPSHDIETDQPLNDNGDHFDMRDYHVISLDQPFGKATDHGNALDVKDVKWAERQMWAPDAAEKDGKYYLYFPAKNAEGIFHIGVAVADQPEGPFTPEETHIQGTYSIDPAVFQDEDNQYYLYIGGLWGGQLQNWRDNQYGEEIFPQDHELALLPKVAKLADNMVDLAETPRDIEILDENGDLLLAGDTDRRYFEGPWLHKHNDTYYFSYSTGDTHKIVYATSESPYGPFTYQGVILEPVLGWTTHHSIAEFEGKWYLFYHDSTLSGGQTHLRNIKMTELIHNEDGSIQTITPYLDI